MLGIVLRKVEGRPGRTGEREPIFSLGARGVAAPRGTPSERITMAEPDTAEPERDETAPATDAAKPEETATAVEAPAFEVAVEDMGVCKKKLSITIPREAIDRKFEERFAELEREAQVPGFRPGHAPRRLIEKRFRRAVAEEVRVGLVSETLTKALEQEKLDVIGEPDIDPESVELRTTGR